MSVYGADDSAFNRVQQFANAANFQNQVFQAQQDARPEHPDLRRQAQERRAIFLDGFTETHRARIKAMMKEYERQNRWEMENSKRIKRGLPPLDPDVDMFFSSDDEEEEEEEETANEEGKKLTAQEKAAKKQEKKDAKKKKRDEEKRKEKELRIQIKKEKEEKKKKQQEQEQPQKLSSKSTTKTSVSISSSSPSSCVVVPSEVGNDNDEKKKKKKINENDDGDETFDNISSSGVSSAVKVTPNDSEEDLLRHAVTNFLKSEFQKQQHRDVEGSLGLNTNSDFDEISSHISGASNNNNNNRVKPSSAAPHAADSNEKEKQQQQRQEEEYGMETRTTSEFISSLQENQGH